MKLEQRLHELRFEEHHSAPTFERVLRGPQKREVWPRLAILTGAVTAVCLALGVALWRQPAPEAEVVMEVLFENEIWTTPSDVLLAESSDDAPEGDAGIATLTRDINQLLNR